MFLEIRNADFTFVGVICPDMHPTNEPAKNRPRALGSFLLDSRTPFFSLL